MNTITPFAVLSFDKDYMTETHKQAVREFGTRQLAHAGFAPRECIGRFDGVQEVSYVVAIPEGDEERIHYLLRLIAAHDQESLLFVDANRQGTLYYTQKGRHPEDIGDWTQISAADIEDRPAYTEIDGMFFICQ